MHISKKINGFTGKVVWEKAYHTMPRMNRDSYSKKIKPSNGGFFATNVLGKNDISNLVIVPVAGYKNANKGLLLAFDKKTGKEIWKWEMPHYTWSSPVDIYDKNGKSYLIQCDSKGNVYLLEGKTGKIIESINLGTNIESSPAIYQNIVVVATRGGKIYGIKIK